MPTPRRLDPRPHGGEYQDYKHKRVIMPDEDYNEQWKDLDKAQAFKRNENRGR